MTRGRSVSLRATLVRARFLGLPAVIAGPGDDTENVIAVRLAVQTALQQGRDNLLKGNYRAAVTILEGQIARIDGSREYLSVLRDAYRAYIRELQLAGKTDEAQTFLKRLRILDPAPPSRACPPSPPHPLPQRPRAPRPTTARGNIDDEPITHSIPSTRATLRPGGSRRRCGRRQTGIRQSPL
jgi:hypothetical protein